MHTGGVGAMSRPVGQRQTPGCLTKLLCRGCAVTQVARLVLEDCRGGLADLTDRVQGATWRRRWVAVITLLRTVGHVLNKVDASSSPKLKAAIANAWGDLNRSKPEPRIFWEFIDQERKQHPKGVSDWGWSRHHGIHWV